MKTLKKILVYSATALLLASCKGDLLDLSPYGSVASGNMWTSENLAEKV